MTPRGWNSTLPVRRERPRRVHITPMAGEGPAALHQAVFRCQELRSLASKAPRCFHCGALNTGQVVACHVNSLRLGKGMGQKAHDVPAYLCRECHDLLDGRRGSLTRHEKLVMFLAAAYDSMVWLLQAGWIQVAA